jgi:hypothetical protein
MELSSRFIHERGEVSALLMNTINDYDYIIVKVHELNMSMEYCLNNTEVAKPKYSKKTPSY